MKITASNPSLADWAATALARLPVEAQPTTSKPKALAWASATATTRSLKERVGKQAASSLSQRSWLPMLAPSRGARSRGVKPTGRSDWKPSATGRNSRYRQMSWERRAPAHRRAQLRQVEGHFERSEAVLAEHQGTVSEMTPALFAAQLK